MCGSRGQGNSAVVGEHDGGTEQDATLGWLISCGEFIGTYASKSEVGVSMSLDVS